jgi:hypothetical protein
MCVLFLFVIVHRHLLHSVSTKIKSHRTEPNICVRLYDQIRCERKNRFICLYVCLLFHTDTYYTRSPLQPNWRQRGAKFERELTIKHCKNEIVSSSVSYLVCFPQALTTLKLDDNQPRTKRDVYLRESFQTNIVREKLYLHMPSNLPCFCIATYHTQPR